MEEKIIVKSTQYSVKKLFVVLLIFGAILSGLLYLSCAIKYAERYDKFYETSLRHTDHGERSCSRGDYHGQCYECKTVAEKSKLAYIIEEVDFFGFRSNYAFIPLTAALIIGGIAYLCWRSYELTVTDKRVYGRTAWGKRVDLPVDSISAISTASLLRGVTVATSSGKISFLMIKNAREIYSSLNELIITRQQEKANNASDQGSAADKLIKYKELMDSGIISQQEFDAKKKQLLGL